MGTITLEKRYYMGKYLIAIYEYFVDKRCLVVFLEAGRVGNKKVGYKDVRVLDFELVYIRNCWRLKKDG